MHHTTFNLCREHEACADGFRKLKAAYPDRGDDEPISLIEVLHSNGIEDAAWAFRATVDNSDREARLFACLCAEDVLPIFEAKHPEDKRPRKAIEVARLHANGEATRDELSAARTAAGVAARDAAEAAAGERQSDFLRKVLAPTSDDELEARHELQREREETQEEN